LLNCAVSKDTEYGSAEAEKNVVVGICKFARVVLHLAIRAGIQPVWPWLCLLTGTQHSYIVISPSFYYPGKFAFGICAGSRADENW
jgi:hypothetical protein